MMRYLITSLIILFVGCKNNDALSTNEQTKKIAKCKNVSNNFVNKDTHEIFFGDSIIGFGYEKYFRMILENKSYLVLKYQNDLYEKQFSNFKNTGLIESNYKFVKQILNSKKSYKIVLYTLINNEKKDSIEFYRNVDDLKYEPSNYTCLSYLDLKNKKIWQIKYFSSPIDKSIDYILYKESKVTKDGKIEKDSLYFLDESQEIKMSEYGL